MSGVIRFTVDGHATIVKMATVFTWIYGILIIPFMIFSSSQINLHKVTTLPTGHFLGGFIGGISIVAVGLHGVRCTTHRNQSPALAPPQSGTHQTRSRNRFATYPCRRGAIAA